LMHSTARPTALKQSGSLPRNILAGKEHLAHDRETLRMKVRICADLEEGRRLWRKLWTQQNLFDLW